MKPLWTLPQVQHIARTEMKELGLPDIGWRLGGWHKEVHTLGTTRYGPRLITLNRQSLPYQTADVIKDIIRHEAAHVGAGLECHHDEHWEAIAFELGVLDPSPVIAFSVAAPSPFLQLCKGCERAWNRYRKTSTQYRCARCHELLEWYDNPLYIKF